MKLRYLLLVIALFVATGVVAAVVSGVAIVTALSAALVGVGEALTGLIYAFCPILIVFLVFYASQMLLAVALPQLIVHLAELGWLP